MELGEKLKQARLAAGLSQRQLCGGEITRNMLSQIENGSARPSMDTLRYLAGQLGKPIGYFLEEEAVTSPNQAVMEQARAAYLRKDHARVLETLENYRAPDAVFDQERGLLTVLACLALAEDALDQGRRPLAAECLDRAETAAGESASCGPELERRRLLLAAKLDPQLAEQLPDLDEELLLRARGALAAGNAGRAAVLLDAAEDREAERWKFLRGEAYLAQGACREAAECYHRAEPAWPEKTAPCLERCYRALEDYKMAYFYACRQKQPRNLSKS